MHKAEFPIPFPLKADEVPAGADPQAVALERAIQRGQHLVHSRAGCNGCHGKDFGGAAIIDIPPVAHWVAPNLTTGEGSVTRGFTANDWDRAVRHGVRHNGQTSSMPSRTSQSHRPRAVGHRRLHSLDAPVNRDMGRVKFGPVFEFVIATDPKVLVAFTIDHDKPHVVEPPAEAPNVELGQHIVQVCRGCHGAHLSGGKLDGDPDMPIVGNITPHETGLKGWSESDFIRALREGKRKDGTDINKMMPWQAYGKMTDTELKALWAYLQTVPPREKGNH